MKVDTMRKIDRYIGIPLCLLICGWYRFVETIIRPKPKKPKQVLLVELSEMGSAILVDPAMRWLKEKQCNLHFVIFEDNLPSLKLLSTIPSENIFTIRSNKFSWLVIDSVRLLLWCRERQIDTTIDLELFSRFTSLLCRMSGAVNRSGYHYVHEEGLYRGNHLSHPLMYNPHLHISQNFMALARAVMGQPNQPYQKGLIRREDISLARAVIKSHLKESVINKIRMLQPDFKPGSQRLVLVNPNASDLLPQRRWMPERFAEVIQTVLDSYEDVLVLITGSLSEQPEAERLREAAGDKRCINTAGLFAFEELVPLYDISELMLSNDSGPPHFASVTDLPTFVIFGPETPALYGALGNSTAIYAGLACSPCVSAGNHRKTSCADNQCLKAISPEQVIEVIKPVLDNQLIARAV